MSLILVSFAFPIAKSALSLWLFSLPGSHVLFFVIVIFLPVFLFLRNLLFFFIVIEAWEMTPEAERPGALREIDDRIQRLIGLREKLGGHVPD